MGGLNRPRIVLGVVAQNGMKQSGNYRGRGMAIAAIIIGIIDIPVAIITTKVYLNSHGGHF